MNHADVDKKLELNDSGVKCIKFKFMQFCMRGLCRKYLSSNMQEILIANKITLINKNK